MHESSGKALRIMQLTTVMGIIIIIWSVLTLAMHPARLHMPPFHPVLLTAGGTNPPVARTSTPRRGNAGHPDRLRPLAAGHERRRIAGAGQSRDRVAQAQESSAGRVCHLPLFDAADESDQLLRRVDHSRWKAGCELHRARQQDR